MNYALRVAGDVLGHLKNGALQSVIKTFPKEKRRLQEFFSIMSLAQTGGEAVN